MSADLIVTTCEGKVRGKSAPDQFGGTYYSFQGIPYAQPPIGNLRFKAPQPAEKWTGVLDATEEGDSCYHKNMLNQFEGSENCLVLNVYTPQLPLNSIQLKKPVMFWIHGGAFTKGSSKSELYGPEYLTPQDIILITINYRIGPLGFLNLEDASLEVPGNAGLKDMVMALKWTQRNIGKFGGDANNITIFGESAGGSAVDLLVLSPMAKGLFHKAIAQSGCALHSWARGRRNGYDLGKRTGFEGYEEGLLLEHLQSVSVDELLKGAMKIPDELSPGIVRPFGPIIEKPSLEPAFLDREPLEILRSGKYNQVPLMMGYTSREGIIVYADLKHKKHVMLKGENFISYQMNLRKGSVMYQRCLQKIMEFYLGGAQEITEENLDNLIKLYTDTYFVHELFTSAKLHLATSPKPLYFYKFSLDTELNYIKRIFSETLPGACHADDLCYLFKGVLSPEIEAGSTEEVCVKTITKLWGNFARYGNPTPVGDNPIKTIWSPVSKGKFCYLDIDEEITMGEDPEEEAMAFWGNLRKLYSSKL